MIRPASADDMPAVWKLVLELAEYERMLDQISGNELQFSEGLNRDFRCWIAEVGGEIVGYALTFPTYSTFRAAPGLWMEDLYVTPQHRGTGLGKQLIETVIEEAKRLGCGRLEWSVLDWNAPSIAFYERLGAIVLPDWRICRLNLGGTGRPIGHV